MRLFLVAFAFFLAAPLANAEDALPAGFAPEVWLSTNLPMHGDTVEAYTVVYDASPEPIEGAVTFLINGESIGSTPFTLQPGETEIRSIRWTAEEGTHVLSARIDSAYHKDTKERADLATYTTASTTIVVKAPPPPEEPETKPDTETKKSTSTPNLIETLTGAPIVGSAISTAIATAENWRLLGQEALQQYASSSTSVSPATTTPQGEVLGTSTETERPQGDSLGASAAKTALQLFIYPIFFYPFFLILLGIALIVLSKKLTNPGSRKRRR